MAGLVECALAKIKQQKQRTTEERLVPCVCQLSDGELSATQAKEYIQELVTRGDLEQYWTTTGLSAYRTARSRRSYPVSSGVELEALVVRTVASLGTCSLRRLQSVIKSQFTVKLTNGLNAAQIIENAAAVALEKQELELTKDGELKRKACKEGQGKKTAEKNSQGKKSDDEETDMPKAGHRTPKTSKSTLKMGRKSPKSSAGTSKAATPKSNSKMSRTSAKLTPRHNPRRLSTPGSAAKTPTPGSTAKAQTPGSAAKTLTPGSTAKTPTRQTQVAEVSKTLTSPRRRDGYKAVLDPSLNSKRRAPSLPLCGFCLGTSDKNRSGASEPLVSCMDCGNSGHPSCLKFSDLLTRRVSKSRTWQCLECKKCSYCRENGSEDKMLFCDACDRGFHMECHIPPLQKAPKGDWICLICDPRGDFAEEGESALTDPALPYRLTRKKSTNKVSSKTNKACRTLGKTTASCSTPGCDGSGNVSSKYSYHRNQFQCPLLSPTERPKRPRHSVAQLEVKPKGLYDSLTRFYTPSNKRTSRTAEQSRESLAQVMKSAALAKSKKLLKKSREMNKKYVKKCEKHVKKQGKQGTGSTPGSTPLIKVTDADQRLYQQAIQSTVSTSPSRFTADQAFPAKIQLGEFEIESWYSAPYPQEYCMLPLLYVCEFCLHYMKSRRALDRHCIKCIMNCPPGDEIYRCGSLSVYEVDGSLCKSYCQNLCLLAKLFLDHKTLYYDVEPFLFYVLTSLSDDGSRLVGYFSKEKHSPRNNLSCIMILPPYQRAGYGHMLIHFSYMLSIREARPGGPEKPLSALGTVSYHKYWDYVIKQVLTETQAEKQGVSLQEISRKTGLHSQDIAETLHRIGALHRKGDRIVVVWNKTDPLPLPRINIDPDCLRWTPVVSSVQLQEEEHHAKREFSDVQDQVRNLQQENEKMSSLIRVAVTSPKKTSLSEEEKNKMEESIQRQKQLDGEGDSEEEKSHDQVAVSYSPTVVEPATAEPPAASPAAFTAASPAASPASSSGSSSSGSDSSSDSSVDSSESSPVIQSRLTDERNDGPGEQQDSMRRVQGHASHIQNPEATEPRSPSDAESKSCQPGLTTLDNNSPLLQELVLTPGEHTHPQAASNLNSKISPYRQDLRRSQVLHEEVGKRREENNSTQSMGSAQLSPSRSLSPALSPNPSMSPCYSPQGHTSLSKDVDMICQHDTLVEGLSYRQRSQDAFVEGLTRMTETLNQDLNLVTTTTTSLKTPPPSVDTTTQEEEPHSTLEMVSPDSSTLWNQQGLSSPTRGLSSPTHGRLSPTHGGPSPNRGHPSLHSPIQEQQSLASPVPSPDGLLTSSAVNQGSESRGEHLHGPSSMSVSQVNQAQEVKKDSLNPGTSQTHDPTSRQIGNTSNQSHVSTTGNLASHTSKQSHLSSGLTQAYKPKQSTLKQPGPVAMGPQPGAMGPNLSSPRWKDCASSSEFFPDYFQQTMRSPNPSSNMPNPSPGGFLPNPSPNPSYPPASPAYPPASPAYPPASPAYPPASPAYPPTSPATTYASPGAAYSSPGASCLPNPSPGSSHITNRSPGPARLPNPATGNVRLAAPSPGPPPPAHRPQAMSRTHPHPPPAHLPSASAHMSNLAGAEGSFMNPAQHYGASHKSRSSREPHSAQGYACEREKSRPVAPAYMYPQQGYASYYDQRTQCNQQNWSLSKLEQLASAVPDLSRASAVPDLSRASAVPDLARTSAVPDYPLARAMYPPFPAPYPQPYPGAFMNPLQQTPRPDMYPYPYLDPAFHQQFMRR